MMLDVMCVMLDRGVMMLDVMCVMLDRGVMMLDVMCVMLVAVSKRHSSWPKGRVFQGLPVRLVALLMTQKQSRHQRSWLVQPKIGMSS